MLATRISPTWRRVYQIRRHLRESQQESKSKLKHLISNRRCITKSQVTCKAEPSSESNNSDDSSQSFDFWVTLTLVASSQTKAMKLVIVLSVPLASKPSNQRRGWSNVIITCKNRGKKSKQAKFQMPLKKLEDFTPTYFQLSKSVLH